MNNNTSLILPRTLVNKIMAHAQHNETRCACGLISQNTEDRMFFYPLRISSLINGSAECFEKKNIEFSNRLTELANTSQTLLACVFSTAQADKTFTIDSGLFPLEPCFYIITSLNTKGVIDMQAYHRHSTALQQIELGIV